MLDKYKNTNGITIAIKSYGVQMFEALAQQLSPLGLGMVQKQVQVQGKGNLLDQLAETQVS